MNFASIHFFIFFTFVLLVYWNLPRTKQNIFLLLASWFFYAFWDWRFLSLIVISTLSNYYCGKLIFANNKNSSRRFWLIVAIVVNIGILVYFKYAGFMVDSLMLMFEKAGISVSRVTLEITLPVGISFYIFQSLSYSLDIYRNKLTPNYSLIDFATFVAFFPQLVAGPIVRATEFLYQLESERKFNSSDFEQGAIRFLSGFFKKVFIADNLAVHLVDPVFSNPGSYSSGILWFAMLGYSVQIYADFSGYSNMAIGCARMLGFKLPENFNFPYLATNFSDFWQRWHMTMSRFFRDYIYISMGGNRRGQIRTLVNLAVTTLVSGLWHGASWTFVAWGGLHGLYIALNHQLNEHIQKLNVAFALIFGWLSTQLLVCFAWILFRSPNFESAIEFFRGLFSAQTGTTIYLPVILYLCIASFIVDHVYGLCCEQFPVLRENNFNKILPFVYATMLIMLFHGQVEEANPFIYFQF
ncbi:MAG: MBOAT family protein [Gammaproteobacteria bacterium]|nr:MBOAT family protein [Gammaproteobacteria bacterium]